MSKGVHFVGLVPSEWTVFYFLTGKDEVYESKGPGAYSVRPRKNRLTLRVVGMT